MNLDQFTKLGAGDAAIVMGINAAKELIQSFRDDRGNMGIDAASDASASAMASLIADAVQNGDHETSPAILISFAMELGEEIYSLMQERQT